MKKKRRFGRRVFYVLIVLFMGVIWQSDLLSQEPAEVRSLRKQEILQSTCQNACKTGNPDRR